MFGTSSVNPPNELELGLLAGGVPGTNSSRAAPVLNLTPVNAGIPNVTAEGAKVLSTLKPT
ncbi:MAG: hypothetical protein EXR84_14225 [Gammaproteobacteria bacterium]|nr:hypothetical protein [Gammaproteobacteria bacterium]